MLKIDTDYKMATRYQIDQIGKDQTEIDKPRRP